MRCHLRRAAALLALHKCSGPAATPRAQPCVTRADKHRRTHVHTCMRACVRAHIDCAARLVENHLVESAPSNTSYPAAAVSKRLWR